MKVNSRSLWLSFFYTFVFELQISQNYCYLKEIKFEFMSGAGIERLNRSVTKQGMAYENLFCHVQRYKDLSQSEGVGLIPSPKFLKI